MALQKGYTPLHLAAKYGSTEIARRLLLQRDVNVDAVAKNGLTPLHVATHYGNFNVVRVLLQHHASPCSPAQVDYLLTCLLELITDRCDMVL